jgi:hypothetical protein
MSTSCGSCSNGCCDGVDTICCKGGQRTNVSGCECYRKDINGFCAQYVHTGNIDCPSKVKNLTKSTKVNGGIYECSTPHHSADHNTINPNKYGAFVVKSKIWRQKSSGDTLVLKVSFMENYEKWRRMWIEKIIKETYEPVCNVIFKFIDPSNGGELGDVRISFVEGIASKSYVGTDSMTIDIKEPTMHLGRLQNPSSFTYKGETYEDLPTDGDITTGVTPVHEFGHVLGLQHELQSPLNKIEYVWENLQSFFGAYPNCWDERNIRLNIVENKFKNYATRCDQNNLENCDVTFSDFDEESIMLYTLPSWTMVGCPEIKRILYLSKNDKKWLQMIYGKSKNPPPPPPSPPKSDDKNNSGKKSNSNDGDDDTPNSNDGDDDTPNSNDGDDDTPNSNDGDDDTPNSNDSDDDTPNSNDDDDDTPNSNDSDDDTPNSNDSDDDTPNSNEDDDDTLNSNEGEVKKYNWFSIVLSIIATLIFFGVIGWLMNN